MAHFLQQAATNGAYLPNGHRIVLDFILDETQDGYLATENGYVVNQIRGAIASKSGGWVEISEADYNEAVKKKANPSPKRKKLIGLNAGMFQPRADVVADVSATAAKPDPVTVPTPEQLKVPQPPRPRVGRLPETLNGKAK